MIINNITRITMRTFMRTIIGLMIIVSMMVLTGCDGDMNASASDISSKTTYVLNDDSKIVSDDNSKALSDYNNYATNNNYYISYTGNALVNSMGKIAEESTNDSNSNEYSNNKRYHYNPMLSIIVKPTTTVNPENDAQNILKKYENKGAGNNLVYVIYADTGVVVRTSTDDLSNDVMQKVIDDKKINAAAGAFRNYTITNTDKTSGSYKTQVAAFNKNLNVFINANSDVLKSYIDSARKQDENKANNTANDDSMNSSNSDSFDNANNLNDDKNDGNDSNNSSSDNESKTTGSKNSNANRKNDNNGDYKPNKYDY